MTQRDPDLLQARQAAALLGIGINAVYDGARRGDIPHRKVGARFLFSRAALMVWAHHVGATPVERAGAESELVSALEKLRAELAALVLELRATLRRQPGRADPKPGPGCG